MKLMDIMAIRQPQYFRTEVAPAERFYVADVGDLVNYNVNIVINNWIEHSVRIPFKHMIIQYGNDVLAIMKEMDAYDPFLVENDREHGWNVAPTGAVLIHFVVRMDDNVHSTDVIAVLGLNDPTIRMATTDRSAVSKLSSYEHERLAQMIYGVVNTITLLHTMRTEYVDAPSKLNARRAKKGKPPALPYHKLVLASKKVHKRKGSGHDGSTRAYHKRRGHFRRYQSGKVLWIKDMMVGDPTQGIVLKDYVVRK